MTAILAAMRARWLTLVLACVVSLAPSAQVICEALCAGPLAELQQSHTCHDGGSTGLRLSATPHTCGHDQTEPDVPTVAASGDIAPFSIAALAAVSVLIAPDAATSVPADAPSSAAPPSDTGQITPLRL